MRGGCNYSTSECELGSLEWVATGQQTLQVEASRLGLDPSSVDVLLGAFLAGDGAQRVLSQEARAFFAEAEVPGKQVVVILHLADRVQLFEDGLLGQGEDLDVARVEVVDGDGDGKFHVGSARAAATFAGLEVAHLHLEVTFGGLVVEAEGLSGAVAGAPALIELEGSVGQQGEADATAIGEFGDLQVAAACAGAGDVG
jgi:hypothetical protein